MRGSWTALGPKARRNPSLSTPVCAEEPMMVSPPLRPSPTSTLPISPSPTVPGVRGFLPVLCLWGIRIYRKPHLVESAAFGRMLGARRWGQSWELLRVQEEGKIPVECGKVISDSNRTPALKVETGTALFAVWSILPQIEGLQFLTP